MSSNVGAQPRWRADGRELFYIGLDGRLMAVPIRLGAGDNDIAVQPPDPLFATQIGGAIQGISRQLYMVSPDGHRFLMDNVTEQNALSITVAMDWKLRP